MRLEVEAPPPLYPHTEPRVPNALAWTVTDQNSEPGNFPTQNFTCDCAQHNGYLTTLVDGSEILPPTKDIEDPNFDSLVKAACHAIVVDPNFESRVIAAIQNAFRNSPRWSRA